MGYGTLVLYLCTSAELLTVKRGRKTETDGEGGKIDIHLIVSGKPWDGEPSEKENSNLGTEKSL